MTQGLAIHKRRCFQAHSGCAYMQTCLIAMGFNKGMWDDCSLSAAGHGKAVLFNKAVLFHSRQEELRGIMPPCGGDKNWGEWQGVSVWLL